MRPCCVALAVGVFVLTMLKDHRPSEGAVRRALQGLPDGLLCGERGNGHARQHGRDGDCPRTTATGRASGWHNREREAGSLKYNPLRPGGHVLSPTILDSP